MTPLVLALALAGQYPTPQAPQYGAPAQYAAPPMTYAAPVTYAAPQVVVLGAGQVMPPSPLGLWLGHIGRKLEAHSWPRVQPMSMAAQAPIQQTIYLQMSQPQVQQAVYTAPQPTYAAPPPQSPMKAPPQTYGSPQAPQIGTPKPSESVPPVPPR